MILKQQVESVTLFKLVANLKKKVITTNYLVIAIAILNAREESRICSFLFSKLKHQRNHSVAKYWLFCKYNKNRKKQVYLYFPAIILVTALNLKNFKLFILPQIYQEFHFNILWWSFTVVFLSLKQNTNIVPRHFISN